MATYDSVTMGKERYYEYEMDYVGIVELDYENEIATVREYQVDKTIEFEIPWKEAHLLAKGWLRKMEVV